MNFLAHAYLSFNNNGILAGNMISDFIKGKKQYDYKAEVFKGIQLHRSIDTFTDAHPATAAINQFFKPHYRLYAGAFTDVLYDYYLANDPNEFFTEKDLEKFVAQTYHRLEEQYDALPVVFQPVFRNMQQYNWLFNYRFSWGIEKSFAGIAYRAKYITESATAYSIFLDNIENIRPYYQEFFPMLKIHAEKTLQQLLHDD